MNVQIKRVYEPFEPSEGYRILIDRLWPRGIKKEDAHIDKWMKDIAPSHQLRKWFNHEPEKWKVFCDRYLTEISKAEVLKELIADMSKHKTIILVYASKEERFNNAVFLRELLLRHTKK